MVYKFGRASELDTLASGAVPAAVTAAMRLELALLDDAYGKNRNIDTDDGGFVLCCTPGTTVDELKAFFDPSEHVFECVGRIEAEPPYCSALYILTNDYAVEVFMAVADAPEDIAAELAEETA